MTPCLITHADFILYKKKIKLGSCESKGVLLVDCSFATLSNTKYSMTHCVQ